MTIYDSAPPDSDIQSVMSSTRIRSLAVAQRGRCSSPDAAHASQCREMAVLRDGATTDYPESHSAKLATVGCVLQ